MAEVLTQWLGDDDYYTHTGSILPALYDTPVGPRIRLRILCGGDSLHAG